MDLDTVAGLVREVAARAVTPRFRRLAAADVSEKAPGDLVTAADREAEALLVEGLAALTPGVPVVGEEAAAGDPALLELPTRPGPVWLVDPLDGTAGFVAGSPDHAVLVALVVDGTTVAAVVHQPQHGRTYTAERGAGAFLDGVRLARRGPVDRPLHELRGAVVPRLLSPAARRAVQANAARFGDLTPPTTCAGVEHPRVADGRADFLLFWRTLPWDHAPGALLVTETGGAALRPDGSDYRPGLAGEGLLVAADPAMAHRVLHGLGLSGPAGEEAVPG